MKNLRTARDTILVRERRSFVKARHESRTCTQLPHACESFPSIPAGRCALDRAIANVARPHEAAPSKNAPLARQQIAPKRVGTREPLPNDRLEHGARQLGLRREPHP